MTLHGDLPPALCAEKRGPSHISLHVLTIILFALFKLVSSNIKSGMNTKD